MKKVDIIIPCYNTHSTLPRVLSSILTQTVKDEIKVILVDDASDEGYDDIVEHFKPFLDIDIITLEKNSGPGTARRVGMQAGNSKYIMCIDSDDTFFNAYSVSKMLHEIEKRQCDICYSNFLEDVDNGKFVPHVNDGIWFFGKIFKRQFLENLNIWVNDTRSNEDVGFNTLTRAFTQPQHVDDFVYIWHFNPKSITRKNNGLYSFTCSEGHIYNMIWAYTEALKRGWAREHYEKAIISQFCWYYFMYFGVKNQSREEIDPTLYCNWVKKYYDTFKNVIDKCLNRRMDKEAYRSAFMGYFGNPQNITEVDVTLDEFVWILENTEDKIGDDWGFR